MLAKILLSVIDTDNIDFDNSESLGIDEYFDKLTESISKGGDYSLYSESDLERLSKVDNKYKTFEIKTYVRDIKGGEIDNSLLEERLSDGRNLLLILDLDPDIDFDAQDEINLWLGVSKKIIDTKLLTDKEKILNLPSKTLQLITKQGKYTLNGCKIVKIYTNSKKPFEFAIIINEITQ
jgi:hypothetical protein